MIILTVYTAVTCTYGSRKPTTGKLVNRDQFRVMPMPESVIKRMNALALADGRVKGVGELSKPNS
jgi:hypothetical protein